MARLFQFANKIKYSKRIHQRSRIPTGSAPALRQGRTIHEPNLYGATVTILLHTRIVLVMGSMLLWLIICGEKIELGCLRKREEEFNEKLVISILYVYLSPCFYFSISRLGFLVDRSISSPFD